PAMTERIQVLLDNMYKIYHLRARHGAKMIADGDGILTMCFAETSFVLAMVLAKKSGKSFTVYVPETRPYLQGARLTAPSLHEVGIQTKLITDGMASALMSEGKIQKYVTAADLITLDGHVVNKVGTLQNAIAAHHHGIAYFVYAWGFDQSKPNRQSVEIEWRNPQDIRQCRGMQTTLNDIDASYPAFDITPPHLVAGVITKHGIFSPYDLNGRDA
ncbi:MAG TPA: translation initiation factor 2, partial [Hellea balneolensis]|nr:translation initiation factor 2 [Hellea balneolensis]